MDELICVNGHSNPPDLKFCGECGTELALVCVNGHANAPTQKFCGECGEPLGTAAPVAATAAPTEDAGERRLVTALFADLVGFTPFTESRDPEEVRAMLTRYFERAQTIIERFGGEVDKFIGDAVTAFWGAKQAQEDDADRAVRAALELVDSVAELGAEIGVPDLALRAGVLTGETSVGSGGNEKGLVVGDIVNTAARLQSSAEPGTVYVGDSTQALTSESIRYEPVGEQDLKGKSVPVAAFRAVDVAAVVGGRGRTDGLEAPFVGRDNELRLLKDQVHATTRDKTAHLVSIVGEAGIGKSRLGWEMKKYLDGVTELFLWHEGRSPAYGDGVTFWALGEMVRQRARIAETDDPLKSRTKLRTTVAESVPDPDEQRWIEPRLAGLLGLDEMPAGDRNELFAALRTFFQRLAESDPVILVFEDLHWADSGLLDFIEELVEWSTRHPILIVTLARPDLLEQRPGWGSGRRNTLSTQLGPLPENDMAELVKGLAPGIPENVVSLIVDRAEGIPLYAVEFVRMLVGSGDLTKVGDRFEMTGTIEELAIPDSLRSVIAARLDRLDPEQRALIQDAAVLGYSFTADRLNIFGERANIEEQLRELIRDELLEFEIDETSPERGQYRFLQSVIREVAYSRLAKAERRDRHVLVAEYYEGLGDVEVSAIAASHYIDAYAADPSDELAVATRRALQRAAERAAELQSHQQVLALATRAIDLTVDEADIAALHGLAAGAALGLVDVETAERHAASALDWYRSNGSIEESTRAATMLGTVHTDSLHPARAIATLEPFYDTDVDGPEQALLAAALGRAFFLNDQTELAMPAVEHAITLAESHRDMATLVDGIVTKGSMLPDLGRPQEGLMVLRGALEFAEQHDFGYVAGRAINNLLVISELDGNRVVGDYAERGMGIAVRGGDLANMHRLYAQRSFWLVQQHRFEEAQAVLDEIDFDYEVPGISDYITYTQTLKDWLTTGDASAGDALRETAAAFLTSEEPQQVSTGADALAGISLYTGNPRRALAEALEVDVRSPWLKTMETALAAALLIGDAESLQLAEEFAERWPFPGRKRDSHQLLVAAGRAVLDGRTDAAVSAFTDLIRLYEEAFTADYLQDGRLLFASVLGDEVPAARAAAETAAREIADAGAYLLLDVWRDALPPTVVEEAG